MTNVEGNQGEVNYSVQAHNHSEYVEWCTYRYCIAKLERHCIVTVMAMLAAELLWRVFDLGPPHCCHAILSLAVYFCENR